MLFIYPHPVSHPAHKGATLTYDMLFDSSGKLLPKKLKPNELCSRMQKSNPLPLEAVAVAVLLPAGFVASANFNSGHAPHCWQTPLLCNRHPLYCASSGRICAAPSSESIVCRSRNRAGDAQGGKRGNQIATKRCFGDSTF